MADFEKENLELQRITAENVRELTSIWTEMFDETMCLQNINKLKEHVENFFAELKEESVKKREQIENEIEVLHGEADLLCRLLKTDIQLPRMEDRKIPLLIIQSNIDKSLTELREQLRRRREEICELLLEQEGLCDELGEIPRPLLADPLPSEEEILEFRNHLDQLKVERMERLNEMSVLRREIKNYLTTLETQVNTDTEDRLLNHRQIKLDEETFKALRRMQDVYGARVQTLSERIDGIRKKLESLWGRLKTSPNTRNKFKRHAEYNQTTYNALKEELHRCESLQSQNIKECLRQIRAEIVEWWDKTLKSETERNRFSKFHSNCYTEDLLLLHEIELEDLKRFYESNRQLFELYDNRKLLWDRMEALEAKASDPGRYNNRGGQLLKEERERKTIATKLPKIEQQIRDLVTVYEETEHQEFRVCGENIIELMKKEWENKRKEKEKLSSARKNVQTSRSATPMSAKTGSMISMRKAPSNTNLSVIPSTSANSAKKRKLDRNEENTPMAKRNLIYSINSPSVFTGRVMTPRNAATPASGHKLPLKSPFKSSLKKSRVIATTIRRRSGRHSSGSKKRSSLGKNFKKKTTVPPTILINDDPDWNTDQDTEDAYESFQKSIEPDSRSSVIHTFTRPASASNMSTRSKRIYPNESRIVNLPNPRSGFHNTQTTPKKSPASCSRKLTTKNLPIII